MNNFKYKIVEIKWFVPLELSHSSYIYTSLIEFSRAENIKLKISSKNLNRKGRITINDSIIKVSPHLNPKINWVYLILDSGVIKKLAFDLNDNPEYFGEDALKHADIYYKRCFQESIVKVLSNNYATKINPLGLPFMVRPDEMYQGYKLKFFFHLFKAIEIFKFDSLLFNRFKQYRIKAINHYKSFIQTRKISDFNSYNTIISNDIFYQKRLFKSNFDEDVFFVNNQRVEIIEMLSANFPSYFYGGLQENEISLKNHPKLISNIQGDQQSFLAAMKKCGICVYTKGLKGSPGWTLPEYLSQGKCILAEPIINILPNSLVNGSDLLFFKNSDDFIELCEELLVNKSKRELLGRNARIYYERNVDPKTFFKQLLITNFE